MYQDMNVQLAQWEGRLTTNHLCNSFGIGRQQASEQRYQRLFKGYSVKQFGVRQALKRVYPE